MIEELGVSGGVFIRRKRLFGYSMGVVGEG